MAFMILGLLLVAMKLAEFGPVAAWGWTWVLLPFGLAAVWWAIADKTGITRRRAMRKMDERKEQRRQRSLEQLGLGIRSLARGGKPAEPVAARPDHKPASRPEHRPASRPDQKPASRPAAPERREPRA
jgi:small Trp-rich protein